MKQHPHYKITIKEVGNPHILTPEYYGEITKKDLIEFFGLDEKDVEWYNIERLN